MDDVEWNRDEQQFISSEKNRLLGKDATATLVIENFGPITETQVDVKKLTLILGKNNTGKSIIAKLITIFKDMAAYSFDKDPFINRLVELDIAIFLRAETKISWISHLGSVFFDGNGLRSSVDIEGIDKDGLKLYSNINSLLEVEGTMRDVVERAKKSKNPKVKGYQDNIEEFEQILVSLDRVKKTTPNIRERFEVLYVPAERDFVSVISGAVFSTLKNRLPISASILSFASRFEQFRSEKSRFNINFLDVEFARENGEDQIYLPNNSSIPINIASSGIKSVVPAYVVLSALENRDASFVALEEPENNLHPTAQKHFANLISRFCLGGNTQMLTVTTHSPYIISAFNNLIQAGTLADEKGEFADEITEIIPRESWIKFKDVSAYVLEGGSVRSIINSEWQGIDAEEIDKASDEIGDEYERLLELKYRNNKDE